MGVQLAQTIHNLKLRLLYAGILCRTKIRSGMHVDRLVPNVASQ